MRILYGGSVKASNAAEIFAVGNVDGALVGGASLKASDFMPIVEAAAACERAPFTSQSGLPGYESLSKVRTRTRCD